MGNKEFEIMSEQEKELVIKVFETGFILSYKKGKIHLFDDLRYSNNFKCIVSKKAKYFFHLSNYMKTWFLSTEEIKEIKNVY